MKLLRGLAELTDDLRGGAVTVGNFDGVHRGHAQIVQRLCQAARSLGGPAVAFTFDPHPVQLLRPEQCPPPLTWMERKARLLEELGVDAMLAYPTDWALLELSPREFFYNILLGELRAKALVEGQNFFFGRNRAGNVQTLSALAAEAGLAMHVVPAVVIDGGPVSSSRIRALVAAGDVAAAARMLTQPHRIRGLVVPGARRGAGLGFPTANLEQIEAMLPAAGVYAGAAHVRERVFPAAIHIGPNVTFGEMQAKVEAHLIGFAGDLYGARLELDFAERIRETKTFPSRESLCQQLAADVQAAREAFARRAAP